MRVVELTAFEVCLPLKRRIKHASATRETSDNLVVRCRLADGTEGWGEGVPREYVTGESIETAFAQLAATPLAEQLDADCDDWDDVIALCERFQPVVEGEDARGCGSNSLRAAVELSLLDGFGKWLGEPVSSVTRRFEPAALLRTAYARVRYSCVITAESRRKEAVSAIKTRIYGFAQCKLKVGLDGVDEAARLRRIRRWLGPQIDLRLDANEAWPARQLLAKVEPLLAYNVSCLEQPVPHEEVEALGELRARLPIPIMLDESLTSLIDAGAALRGRTCDLFNIRISKCGGFLNSLRLAGLAHEHALGYQLGCHPGESAILSAAGRHWAASVAGIRYLEGSYDRHVLAENLSDDDVTFGFGGWAPAIERPGLGITINPDKLARLARRREDYRLAEARVG